MAQMNVIDELVVLLRLDTKEYKAADQKIGQIVDQTEKKAKDIDAKRKKRDTDQIKRNKETLKSVKELAGGFKKLAFTVAGMLGVGSVGGIVSLITSFGSMETGLRRAAVGTQLSNKEMQAWSATARRLGADAQAGTAAVAEFVREQKTFNLTGGGPTMQAFARIGVRVGPNTAPVEAIEQAQQIYRGANPAQKQQIESSLTAQGVPPDLIIAIKSETDVRQAYSKSLAESTEEDKKSLSALYDAQSAVSNALTAFANTVTVALTPYIKDLGTWASQAAIDLGAFVGRVVQAGGGVDGFFKVLDNESPGLSANLKTLGTALVGLGETALVLVYGFKEMGRAVSAVSDWVFKHLGGTAQQNVTAIGDWVKKAWNDAVQNALHGNPDEQAPAKLTPPRSAGGGASASGAKPSIGGRPGVNPTPAEFLAFATGTLGLPPQEAIAFLVNAQHESSLKASNVAANGASGLFQYLHPERVAAYKAAHGGLSPDQTSWQEQFRYAALSDPVMQRAMRGLDARSTAAQYTERLSTIGEAHGNAAETLRRVADAERYASAYGGNTGGNTGQQININGPVSVQANNPQEFIGGIQRISGVQSYNSAVR